MLANDPDFARLVPRIYYGRVPHVFVDDLTAFQAFKRRKALDAGKRKVGRPRKSAA
jgi:hypothetical protein